VLVVGSWLLDHFLFSLFFSFSLFFLLCFCYCSRSGVHFLSILATLEKIWLIAFAIFCLSASVLSWKASKREREREREREYVCMRKLEFGHQFIMIDEYHMMTKFGWHVYDLQTFSFFFFLVISFPFLMLSVTCCLGISPVLSSTLFSIVRHNSYISLDCIEHILFLSRYIYMYIDRVYLCSHIFWNYLDEMGY